MEGILVCLQVIEVVTLIIALVVAIMSVRSNVRLGKLKSTHDMINQVGKDPTSMAGVDILRFLDSPNNTTTGESLALAYEKKKIMQPEKKGSVKEKKIELARQLYTYLNLLERMCVGINKGLYDNDVCKIALYNKVVKGWGGASDFIKKARKSGGSTLYQELEIVKKNWEKDKLQKRT